MTCFTPRLVKQRAFHRAARAGNNFSSQMMRNLDCGHADPARAGVDENGVTLSIRATFLSACQEVMNTTGMVAASSKER